MKTLLIALGISATGLVATQLPDSILDAVCVLTLALIAALLLMPLLTRRPSTPRARQTA